MKRRSDIDRDRLLAERRLRAFMFFESHTPTYDCIRCGHQPFAHTAVGECLFNAYTVYKGAHRNYRWGRIRDFGDIT